MGVAYDVSLPLPNMDSKSQTTESQASHRRLRTVRKLVMTIACSCFTAQPVHTREVKGTGEVAKEHTRITHKMNEVWLELSPHKPTPINGNTPYLQCPFWQCVVGRSGPSNVHELATAHVQFR